MSETAVSSETTQVASTPKKSNKGKVSGGAKKVKAKPSHPKTSDMVNAAIKNLKERGGSSLQAIKKYISSNYKVDAEKLAPFIRNYLKSAVTSGSLVQTKGKGASGSFKLAFGEKASAKKKISKPAAASKSAESKAKKLKTSAKKESVKSATKSPAKAKSSTPSKAKKAKKVPTKKPKAPKPKKVGAAKPKTVKKVPGAAKKK